MLRKLSLLLLIVVSYIGMRTFAQEQSEADKKWQDYMTPGLMHEKLAESVGEWDATVKMYSEPGKDPMISHGTMIYQVILGGRYLRGDFTGDMMGQTFHGINIIGYDNAVKEFNSVWIDDMGTGMMYEKGKYNEKKQITEMTGKMVDPMKAKTLDTYTTIARDGADKETMKMYIVNGKNKVINMEIVYTRKK